MLARIGGARYAEAELISFDQAVRAETRSESSSWRELFQSGVRRILLVGIALAVLQQWTGINTLFNYAAEVYRNAGYGANDIFLTIVITGAINLVFTVLATLLVDRVGRRPPTLFGCVGIGVSHLLCAWAYHARWSSVAVLLLTLSAIACYALTLAPVVWVLVAEIFPNRVRSQGVSAAVSALWIASFVLTYTFPLLNSRLGTAGNGGERRRSGLKLWRSEAEPAVPGARLGFEVRVLLREVAKGACSAADRYPDLEALLQSR